ncbi:hypothetical protein AB0I54_44510 [Streptomyces sp. NPDC050625]|uniref:dioxygenase family protein n=1 Tax=Streptomyces sp. NPDC050625 TaxID=3154629 RepID=UPI00343C1548
MTDTTIEQATAATSRAFATERFRNRRQREMADVDTKRVDTLVSELLAASYDIIRRYDVTYADQGTFKIHTVEPTPYRIPTDGSCGRLIAAAGWHAWRPAHLHLKVSAPGHQLITTQLYFKSGEHVAEDIASAVKPELILDPFQVADGNSREVTCNFVLDKV